MSGRSSEEALHRVVVVGGGAAGMELVTQLGDRLGRRAAADHHNAMQRLLARAPAHTWNPFRSRRMLD